MKKYLFLFFVLTSVGTMAQDQAAKFKWDASEFDFGKVAKGIPVSHEFSFVNTGKETLIITDVRTSCGCATPTWTKDPLPPGTSGVVKATFNAADLGVFNKSVTVTANVEGGVSVLTIKGEVVDKADLKALPAGALKAEKKPESGANTTEKTAKKAR